MELYFLGTGAGMPSRQRNVTSIVLNVLDECGSCWMFDCGEGTQHQILQTPVKLAKLHKLFVTHLHGDHLFGIPGLLTSRSNQGGVEPLTVYGPPGIRPFIETSLAVSDSHLNYELHIVEIGEGVVCEDAYFIVEAALLDHRIDSYGYRIVEKEKTGALDASKLRALGLRPGPIYGELKRGQSVTLPDGRTIHGSEIVGPPIPGRIVTVLGDTRYCEASIRLSEQADVVVHEATFAGDREELAEQFYHSTSVQAAKVALEANAHALILTHISSRYPDEEAARLLNEACQLFPNTVMARDFWSYLVPRKGGRPS